MHICRRHIIALFCLYLLNLSPFAMAQETPPQEKPLPIKMSLSSENKDFSFQLMRKNAEKEKLITFSLKEAHFIPIDSQRIRLELKQALRFHIFKDGEFYADKTLRSFVITMSPELKELIMEVYPGRVFAFEPNARLKMDYVMEQIKNEGLNQVAKEEVLTGLSRPALKSVEQVRFHIDFEGLGHPQGTQVYGFTLFAKDFASLKLTQTQEGLIPIGLTAVRRFFMAKDPLLRSYTLKMQDLARLIRTQVERGWVDGYVAGMKNRSKKQSEPTKAKNLISFPKVRSCKSMLGN